MRCMQLKQKFWTSPVKDYDETSIAGRGGTTADAADVDLQRAIELVLLAAVLELELEVEVEVEVALRGETLVDAALWWKCGRGNALSNDSAENLLCE